MAAEADESSPFLAVSVQALLHRQLTWRTINRVTQQLVSERDFVVVIRMTFQFDNQ